MRPSPGAPWPAITRFLAIAALAAGSAISSPAGAQAGRDGCYFGECPGGRPAAPTTPEPDIVRPPSAPPRATRPAAVIPIPRKPTGPKVGGQFCATLTEIANLAREEFKSITAKRVSISTLAVKRSLPGADVCSINQRDGQNDYLCLWEVEPKNLPKVVGAFVETVSNCFDGAESEAYAKAAHRIAATRDADILVIGSAEEKGVVLAIIRAKEEKPK